MGFPQQSRSDLTDTETDASVPAIAIVDDNPDEVQLLSDEIELHEGFDCTVLDPSELDLTTLIDCDLILVDYDLRHWNNYRASGPIACVPEDGVALATIFRRHLTQHQRLEGEISPTAFAILTAQIEPLAYPLPTPPKQHGLYAKVNNVEWVFEKIPPEGEERSSAICALAEAVSELPPEWRSESAKACLTHLLRMPEDDGLWEDVESCRPPIHRLSTATHGLAVLRWLIQDVLPHPTFLWHDIRLAARLRVTLPTLNALLSSDHEVIAKLQCCRYQGTLSNFDGRRWWRRKVEDFLWTIGQDQCVPPRQAPEALLRMVNDTLETISPEQHVTCIDRHLQTVPYPVTMDVAVRVRPDAWPAFAEQAWAELSEVDENNLLSSLVIVEDRGRLPDSSGPQ